MFIGKCIIECWIFATYFVIYRPSQIVCMVTIVHITCMQTSLCIHKNLCMVFMLLSKDNLDLPMSFISALWLVASSLVLCVNVPTHLLRCTVPARAMNCENCQLFIFADATNLSQLRTIYCPPTQTIML